MTKAQTENQGSEIGFEQVFQAGLGLLNRNIVTEHVKKLQDAMTEQQEKADRLLEENNKYLSSERVH